MTPRMRVYLQFISNAPLPPHHGSDQGGNQRYEHQNNPAQPAQCLFVETEGERLRDLWRDSDKLFSTKQPVHTARDEILPLLICAAPFFDCCADCWRHITLIRVSL